MIRPAAFLLDLDGTLYVHGAAVPGAPETIRRLRRAGVPFRFVTNTTSRSRRAIVERLRGYGFDAAAPEITTPLQAVEAIARVRGYSVLAPFLPEASLEDLAGFALVGGTSGRASGAPGRGAAGRGTRPQAVVIGDLGERWDYALMQEAFRYLLDGAALLALSRDRYWMRDDGLALDAGPFVAGLEYATSMQAQLVGKPSPEFFRSAVASLSLSGGGASDDVAVAMVGDDLWSDVRGAQAAGYQGWLVRTGKFREDALAASGIQPDRMLASVADLATLLDPGGD